MGCLRPGGEGEGEGGEKRLPGLDASAPAARRRIPERRPRLSAVAIAVRVLFELDCRLADQIIHAKRNSSTLSLFPFSMESLASQAKPLAVLWLAGFFEAARLHRVISLCASSKALSIRIAQCFLLNGLIFLGRLSDEIAKSNGTDPCFFNTFKLCTFEILEKGASDSYNIAQSEDRPDGFDRVALGIGEQAYSLLLLTIFFAEVSVIGYIPYFGKAMNFVLLSLMYAYYCFDYRWNFFAVSLNKRLDFFESNWAFFAGFVLHVLMELELCDTEIAFFHCNVLIDGSGWMTASADPAAGVVGPAIGAATAVGSDASLPTTIASPTRVAGADPLGVSQLPSYGPALVTAGGMPPVPYTGLGMPPSLPPTAASPPIVGWPVLIAGPASTDVDLTAALLVAQTKAAAVVERARAASLA
ncbi:hypothetical protein PR202_gb15629 [Eleusine coracana subsp. coracana]|uniref:Uncharacterized protein n=1 Tax=Eleusine coracana subsp. coracana TaxID=191504 RepID=A0AAV5EZG0_ELECO|nr:hypothetical protein PR202_gb15629 [Eleusine coracana subsp. coracana]